MWHCWYNQGEKMNLWKSTFGPVREETFYNPCRRSNGLQFSFTSFWLIKFSFLEVRNYLDELSLGLSDILYQPTRDLGKIFWAKISFWQTRNCGIMNFTIWEMAPKRGSFSRCPFPFATYVNWKNNLEYTHSVYCTIANNPSKKKINVK